MLSLRTKRTPSFLTLAKVIPSLTLDYSTTEDEEDIKAAKTAKKQSEKTVRQPKSTDNKQDSDRPRSKDTSAAKEK